MRTSITRKAATAALVVIASVAVVLGSAAPSGAVSVGGGGYRTPLMTCNSLTGDVGLFAPMLPLQPTYTIFAISVDGGGWKYSSWYWSSNLQHFMYANGWQQSAGEVTFTLVTGRHTVTGWAYQVAGGVANWVSLGTCDATNVF